MIHALDLAKRYGELKAVDGLTFEIRAGEAFGLLGPNGAGKTTTILMLVGALSPDSGSVKIGEAGNPTQPSVRNLIGVTPQSLAIYEELSGQENLELFARLYGLSRTKTKERVEWGLRLAGLLERQKKRASTYSGGMKRRLNLACALVHEPKVLICDEPTVGVDPQSRNHIFDSIEKLKDEGCTLIYTTHYMEEAQRLCDRIAIMDHGKILAIDEVEKLLQTHGGSSVVEARILGPAPKDLDPSFELKGQTLRIETDHPFESVASLGKSGIEIENLRIDRPDLERVFLNLTGRSLRD